jgi:hypothetical protein
MTPRDILKEALTIQEKKSRDYQNGISSVRQSDYYPRGCRTIHEIMHGKMLRMKSILDTCEQSNDYEPNFESLRDSAVDLINYASFFVSYIDSDIDGQDKTRDFLNRPYDENK